MNEIQQYIPDQDARKSLANKLNLEYAEDMQDWEYEVSDYHRLSDFIEEYDKAVTSVKEREALMEIILDSLNDLLETGNSEMFQFYFPKIEKRLIHNFNIHSATLKYWRINNFKISQKL